MSAWKMKIREPVIDNDEIERRTFLFSENRDRSMNNVATDIKKIRTNQPMKLRIGTLKNLMPFRDVFHIHQLL
jgi:hypothetical protein